MASFQAELAAYERVLRQIRGETESLRQRTAAGTDLEKIIEYRRDLPGWIAGNTAFTDLMGDGTTDFATYVGGQYSSTAATLRTEALTIGTELVNVRTRIANDTPSDINDNILGIKFDDVGGDVVYDSYTAGQLANLTTDLTTLRDSVDAFG